jgi:hypothetical protein
MLVYEGEFFKVTKDDKNVYGIDKERIKVYEITPLKYEREVVERAKGFNRLKKKYPTWFVGEWLKRINKINKGLNDL